MSLTLFQEALAFFVDEKAREFFFLVKRGLKLKGVFSGLKIGEGERLKSRRGYSYFYIYIRRAKNKNAKKVSFKSDKKFHHFLQLNTRSHIKKAIRNSITS